MHIVLNNVIAANRELSDGEVDLRRSIQTRDLHFETP